jgi:hypothetical protein
VSWAVWQGRLTTWGLWATLVGTLGSDTLGGLWPLAAELGITTAIRAVAWLGLTVYMLLAWTHLGRGGRIFMLLSGALIIPAVLYAASPVLALERALDRAIFIASLYSALGFLREAAETSTMVRRCGEFLAAQPPGRRYVALSIGGHLFGLILNFGCIALLGTLVVKATGSTPLDDPMEELRRQRRQQRMMTAIHRGFAAILVWSPMTVSTAVVLSALPNVGWADIAGWGLVSAVGLLMIGWILDRLVKIPSGMTPTVWKPQGSWVLLLPICSLVLAVFGLGALLQQLLQVRLVMAVMIAAPTIGGLWLLAQTRSLFSTACRLRAHGQTVFPRYRKEIVLLSSAAFVGSMVATLLPPDQVIAVIKAVSLPPWALLSVLGAVVVLLGQLGLNPILSVTVLTGALPSPEALGVPAVAVAVALSGAWALTSASSPFGAATMLVGQMTQVGAFTAGARWNGGFAIFGFLFITVLTALVAHVVPG